jgi:general stress protein YciG
MAVTVANVIATQFQPYCSDPLQRRGFSSKVKLVSRPTIGTYEPHPNPAVAQNLISPGYGGRWQMALSPGHDEEGPRDRDPGEAPELPEDEPQPPPVEDPPPEWDRKGPYTVSKEATTRCMEGTLSTERKERRGFASMSPEKQREIASKGGRAAHEKGTAHEWTADEARSAGRKGGQVSRGGRGRLVVPPDAPEASGPQAAAPPERFDANQPE